MKKLVNSITVLRILLSIVILFLRPFSILFSVIYVICGLSDIADGYLARKYEVTSSRGALLDTMADFTMFMVVAIKVLHLITIPAYIVIWILAIAIVKVLSVIICYLKFHCFVILHTYGNKFTGLLLFLMILLYTLIPHEVLYCVISTAASWAAIEELIINIKSKKLNRDIKGLLF